MISYSINEVKDLIIKRLQSSTAKTILMAVQFEVVAELAKFMKQKMA